jgi:hypothetical protein
MALLGAACAPTRGGSSHEKDAGTGPGDGQDARVVDRDGEGRTEPRDGGEDDDGDPQRDGGSPVDPCAPAACGDEELCGSMGTGDGNDDDCDGTVDEGCDCPSTGVTRNCFKGPPDRRGVGACADGVMTCGEFLTWGPCTGGTWPEDEVCDGADNDCNGVPDDGLEDCETSLNCPGTQTASPLNDHALSGSEIYTGDAQSWNWSVECPSNISPCPSPDDPSARDTSVYFTQSGSYTVSLEVVTQDGETLSCDWTVRVEGAGLRVELLWDTQGEGNGDTDVDLHLHRKSVPQGQSRGESDFFTNDDCYYATCKATTYELQDEWDTEPTNDLSACRNAPHGQGDSWEEKGQCYNPRLDVDVINCDPSVSDPSDGDYCAPENINIDNPEPGQPYRIMVNYYSDHGHDGPTKPTVNIYCGGERRATLGEDITLENGSNYGESNDNWLVADVVFFRPDGQCGELECMINPLGEIQQGPDFGPPWSY